MASDLCDLVLDHDRVGGGKVVHLLLGWGVVLLELGGGFYEVLEAASAAEPMASLGEEDT